jgi:hypothetical protein
MTRLLGLAVDPTAGGSTLDAITSGGVITIPDPTFWVPDSNAQVTDGYENTDRGDEKRGVRGPYAPVPFRAKPTLTFTVRLYHPIATWLLPAALGKRLAPVGSAPAAIKTPFVPADGLANLPSFFAWVVREGQTDRLSGVVIESVALNVTAADPTLEVTARALYQEPVVTPTLPSFSFAGMDDPYAAVTFKAQLGASGSEVPISCVGDFTMSYTNGFEDDADVVYCRGENVLSKLVGGRYLRRQWPGRHLIGEQSTTGTLTFGTTRQDMEDRKLFATATRFIADIKQNPIAGTNPPADRNIRITIPQWVVTGGSADPSQRTGPIKSSYEWGGFVDPTTTENLRIEILDSAPIPLIPA